MTISKGSRTPRLALAAYRATARLARTLPVPAGVRSNLTARMDACRWWDGWVSRHRTDSPLLWLHGASAGELHVVSPLLMRLRRHLPQAQVVVTHTSTSAAGTALPGADAVGLLPPDEPGPMRRFMDGLRPSLIAAARGDLWPEVMLRAQRSRIPLALFGATVSPKSLRDHAIARPWLRHLYGTLAWIGAVTHEDAARCERAGARPAHIEVTGDPRHDAVVERVPDLATLEPLAAWARQGPVLVAGSIEPDDEPLIMDVAARTRTHGARLLVFPHEPSASTLKRLRRRVASRGMDAALWTAGGGIPAASIVLVGGTGLLADAYGLGTSAYVGGGLRAGGVHAVAEAAVWGLPMAVGPGGRLDRDVVRLAAVGAVTVLPPRDTARALASWWEESCRHPETTRRAGLAGRGVLDVGAAGRSAEVLRRLVKEVL